MTANKLTLSIWFVLLGVSCQTTRTAQVMPKCKLAFDTNRIEGTDIGVRDFYQESSFLPRVIEELLYGSNPRPKIEYRDFSKNTLQANKFAGYHITGCQDTTWAKQTMADHLMDKYNIYRYDSFYIDTVYMARVIDTTKIPAIKDCDYIGSGASLRVNQFRYQNYDCYSWGGICAALTKTRGMDHEKTTVESESRPHRYSVKVPYDIYADEGMEAYQQYLQDTMGIDFKFLRYDTVRIGVYETTKPFAPVID